MATNKITKGYVTFDGEHRAGVKVKIYDQEYFLGIPTTSTLLKTTHTGDADAFPDDYSFKPGEYRGKYSPSKYGGSSLDEDRVETRPGQLYPPRLPEYGPGKPDIFVEVWWMGEKLRTSGVRRDFDKKICVINLNIPPQPQPENQGILDTLAGAATSFLDWLGDTIHEACDAAADEVEEHFDNPVGDVVARGLRGLGDIAHSLGHGASDNIQKPYIVASDLGRSVDCVAQPSASGVNVSDVATQYSYSEGTVAYEVRLQNNIVEYRDNAAIAEWKPIVPAKPETYQGELRGPIAISFSRLRGEGRSEGRSERTFEMYEAPKFDMIAASENRLFAKEKGKDNFYIACLVPDFQHFARSSARSPVSVPGFYMKIDPQQFMPAAKPENLLLIDKDRYYRHPSLANFLLYNIGYRGSNQWLITALFRQCITVVNEAVSDAVKTLASVLFVPDVMIVRFDPRIWYLMDSRPPKESGRLPGGVTGYDHVTYGRRGIGGEIRGARSERSIAIERVQGIGVGRLHRHTHYDESHGGELHVLAFNLGPIADFASFFDGTCNYFILAKLKAGKDTRQTYGLLWIDEQTYYSERWRLVHPEDKDWNPGRGIASFAGLDPLYDPYCDGYDKRMDERFHLKLDKFWCPFKAEHITNESRFAVARQIIIVSGKDPDHIDDVSGGHRLFSVVFSWGSIDRTWRWREFPRGATPIIFSKEREEAIRAGLEGCTADIDTFSPQLIGLRDDMTIYVRGTKSIGGNIRDGYWYQKYLPADNWEHPFIVEPIGDSEGKPWRNEDHNEKGKPVEGFDHPWQFVVREVFDRANKFSHFGAYETIDSRSQCYEVEIKHDSAVSGSDLLSIGENACWIADREEFSIIEPELQIDYGELEDYLLHPDDYLRENDVIESLQRFALGEKVDRIGPFILRRQPPTLFNPNLRFRILNRTTLQCASDSRFIATFRDKRDDDLLGIKPRKNPVYLKLEGSPSRKLKVTFGRRLVVWKPPIVQRVTLLLDEANRALSIGFISRVPRRPRYLQHWRRIENFRSLEMDMRPDRKYFDPESVNPYAGMVYPCSDITIHRVKINALTEKGPVILLNVNAREFSEIGGEFWHRCQWDNQATFDQVLQYLIEPTCHDFGTSVIFEDLVGHVATAESMEFSTSGGNRQNSTFKQERS